MVQQGHDNVTFLSPLQREITPGDYDAITFCHGQREAAASISHHEGNPEKWYRVKSLFQLHVQCQSLPVLFNLTALIPLQLCLGVCCHK